MEEWRDIEGYEGLYQISNLGRVKSFPNCKRKTTRILKPGNNCTGRGYLFIFLFKNKQKKRFYVHRLVAQAFIPNPNNLPMINHKDENPLNNNLNNLEWCDYKYNGNYGTVKERIGQASRKRIKYRDSLGRFCKGGDLNGNSMFSNT